MSEEPVVSVTVVWFSVIPERVEISDKLGICLQRHADAAVAGHQELRARRQIDVAGHLGNRCRISLHP